MPRMAAAERREQITAVARELFAERGYRAVAVDEIARRAGVSPPVLYDHFASKRDLYAHLLERQADELATRVARATVEAGRRQGAPARRLRRLLRARARTSRCSPATIRATRTCVPPRSGATRRPTRRSPRCWAPAAGCSPASPTASARSS